MSYTYTLPDTAPPQNNFDKKYIDVHHIIASCVAAQTQAFMSANVDDIYVNTAATLATAAPKALAEGAPVTELIPGPEPFIPEPDDMGWVPDPEPDFPKPAR